MSGLQERDFLYEHNFLYEHDFPSDIVACSSTELEKKEVILFHNVAFFLFCFVFKDELREKKACRHRE